MHDSDVAKTWIAISPGGTTLGVGTATGRVHLVDLIAATTRVFDVGDFVVGLAWSAACDTLIVGTRAGTIQIRSSDGTELLRELRDLHDGRMTMALDRAGLQLTTCGADGTARVWDLADGRERYRVRNAVTGGTTAHVRATSVALLEDSIVVGYRRPSALDLAASCDTSVGDSFDQSRICGAYSGTVIESSLVRPFLDAAPASVRPALEQIGDLDRRLWTIVAEGRTQWPNLPVDAVAVVMFLGRQVTAEMAEAALDGLRPGDLYLACACAVQTPGAVAQFDRDYMKEVDIALARMRIAPARVADVKQLVRQRLFVGTDGGNGKISEYGGRGDLRRWVRSVAVRTCLNDLRKGKREILVDDDQLIAQHAEIADDPEIDYMKRTYSTEFRASFQAALAGLGAREQTLLRYHHVDGLNIDEIGAIYRVHRVTAFRWLEKAKEQLVKDTLESLRARLKLPQGELESVLRMIRSQIHLSLVRVLGGPTDNVADDAIELDASELEEVDGT